MHTYTGPRPEVGDIVTYRLRGGGYRTVRVDEVDDNIKNGEPGFDGTVLDSAGESQGWSAWGYDEQIVTITKEER